MGIIFFTFLATKIMNYGWDLYLIFNSYKKIGIYYYYLLEDCKVCNS